MHSVIQPGKANMTDLSCLGRSHDVGRQPAASFSRTATTPLLQENGLERIGQNLQACTCEERERDSLRPLCEDILASWSHNAMHLQDLHMQSRKGV